MGQQKLVLNMKDLMEDVIQKMMLMEIVQICYVLMLQLNTNHMNNVFHFKVIVYQMEKVVLRKQIVYLLLKN